MSSRAVLSQPPPRMPSLATGKVTNPGQPLTYDHQGPGFPPDPAKLVRVMTNVEAFITANVQPATPAGERQALLEFSTHFEPGDSIARYDWFRATPRSGGRGWYLVRRGLVIRELVEQRVQ